MPTTASEFAPAEIDATKWSNLEPLFRDLIDRPLKCAGCLEQLLLDRSKLDAATSEAHANLYIEMTCHTDDEAIKNAYLDFVENVDPPYKLASFELDKKIAGCPHASDLDPQRYEVLLRNTRVDVALFREENVPLQTEETKLAQQYEEICGAMTVQFRGREKTLPQMARFLEEIDHDTRREAWTLIAERRHQDHEKISDIFDALIKLRHQMALNAGFENYRDFAHKHKHRFDYTPEDCFAYHKGAEQVCVPVYRQLNAERTAALKVDPLRPWDLAVDVKGRAPLRPFENADELVERTSKIFHRMNPALGEIFDSMRDGECLDLESRKDKALGGYQFQRDRSRRPFIFMNAAGVHRDLQTMVHEAGHAFHSMLSREDPLVWYRHSPTEFAEVASMSMELLAFPYLDEFYSTAEADRARRGHLEDLSQRLPWIATIDAFQQWIYTNPTHSRDQRTQYWRQLNDRFGAVVSWKDLESHLDVMWQRQLHLFGVPFYYIEYGIAQLGSLQLWCQSLRDEQAALNRYQQALALGGSRPLPELFSTAGLRFEFGPDVMRGLMDQVKSQLATLPA